MAIYFIRPIDGGLIKIGYAVNPKRRLAQLQLMCPVKLNILATIEGDRFIEGLLHTHFKSINSHGEWFEPSQELIDFIDDPHPLIVRLLKSSRVERQIKNLGARNLNVVFGGYLSRLKAIEAEKPPEKRLAVPSISELADCVGIHQTSLSRLANNQLGAISLDLGRKIITEMRRRGFQMQVTDLVTYRPPE